VSKKPPFIYQVQTQLVNKCLKKSLKQSFNSKAHYFKIRDTIPTNPANDDERKAKKDLETSSELNSKKLK
jgi:hypothetical protein